MKEKIKKDLSFYSPTDLTNKYSKEKNDPQNSNIYFSLKQLHGDKQIYLGQSILALIALNRSPAYSEQQNKFFAIELFASLIDELKITPDELRKELDNRENWNQE